MKSSAQKHVNHRLGSKAMRLARSRQEYWASLKACGELLWAAGSKWSADNVPRLSAAVSFYAMLSLAPFLILGTVVAIYYLGTGPHDRFSLLYQVRQTMGQETSDLLTTIIEKAQKQHGTSVLASLVSFIIMFFSASNLFLQFDDSVRSIWGTKQNGSIVKLIILSRLTAFASIIVFGAGLIGWLFLDARMAYLARQAADFHVGRVVSFLSTFLVLMLGCSVSMKRLATSPLKWHDVWIGAAIAAMGISLAKYLLSLYFANSSVSSVYGPAGALVVILLWIYYCSQIYFFGLEVVCVYSAKYGSHRQQA
jgi:membrane protein